MKGVVLAGGTGSRLNPLTRVTNKHLLPVYDKPMVYYPIQTLVNAGIREILLVTGGKNAGDFLRLLGNGREFGLKHINYTYQEGEGGIAEALGLAEFFAAGDPICVILGDNIIENNICDAVSNFKKQKDGAKILVTGGAGFIGSNFIRVVLGSGKGYSIVNFDKLTYAGNLANLESIANDPRYSFVKGDICDAAAVEAAMQGCDAVVHFAAESH